MSSHDIIVIGKIFCLFIGIAYSFTCIAKVSYGQSVAQPQIFLMSAGIAGFVGLQWLI